MTPEQLKNIIEAALMTSSGPMTISRIVSLFEKDAEQPGKDEVRAALEQLQSDYDERGVELKEVASGFRFQVRPEYADWVNRLFDERPQRYSRALLETLAIIAYRQPITRGEIEDIRGVSISSSIVKTLQEREWIRTVGHRDVPGKPELLATTRQFLDYFNLKKLSDLPSLAEIKDFDKINPDLFEGLEQDESQNEDKNDEAGVTPELEVVANTDEAPEQAETTVIEESNAEEVASAEPSDSDELPDEEELDVAANDNVVPFSN